MNLPDRERLRALITRLWPLIAVLLAAGGITLGVTIGVDDNGDGQPDHVRTFTVLTVAATPHGELPGHAQALTVDTDNQLEPDEQAAAAEKRAPAASTPDVHEDMRDETPPGVSAAQLAAGRKDTAELAHDELVAPAKPAGAQNYSCKTAPVRNQGALTARRVGVALHFTVSAPGSADAIRRLFDTPSFGASANALFEPLTSRCLLLVPFARKAWAQLAANSAYYSIEIVTNDRSRASWLATDMFRRGTLAAFVRDLVKRIGAPMKFVDPVGCAFTPGITDHDHLECGNSHWDVGKNFPWDVFLRQVRAGVITAPDRITCRKLNWWRAHGRPHGKAEANAVRRKRALTARGVTCTATGPTRR
jgi:hypothetical protein